MSRALPAELHEQFQNDADRAAFLATCAGILTEVRDEQATLRRRAEEQTAARLRAVEAERAAPGPAPGPDLRFTAGAVAAMAELAETVVRDAAAE